MANPPTNVPIALPKFANMNTSKILVILLRQKPLKCVISSATLSNSRTCGLRRIASTNPATQPAATAGLSEVKGAATNAVAIVIGWPNAIAVPSAESVPLIKNHR